MRDQTGGATRVSNKLLAVMLQQIAGQIMPLCHGVREREEAFLIIECPFVP